MNADSFEYDKFFGEGPDKSQNIKSQNMEQNTLHGNECYYLDCQEPDGQQLDDSNFLRAEEDRDFDMIEPRNNLDADIEMVQHDDEPNMLVSPDIDTIGKEADPIGEEDISFIVGQTGQNLNHDDSFNDPMKFLAAATANLRINESYEDEVTKTILQRMGNSSANVSGLFPDVTNHSIKASEGSSQLQTSLGCLNILNRSLNANQCQMNELSVIYASREDQGQLFKINSLEDSLCGSSSGFLDESN